MNSYNPLMYAFNAPIVPTHEDNNNNNRRTAAVDPQHLDCGRRLSFDDSVGLPMDNHRRHPTTTVVSSRRKNALWTTTTGLTDVTSITNNTQNNNHHNSTKTLVKTPASAIVSSHHLNAPPTVSSASRVSPSQVKEEDVSQMTTTTTPRSDISASKYSLLFNPQGSRPLTAQLTFPGRYTAGAGGGAKSNPPSSLQLSYASGVRSQVLVFGRNKGGAGSAPNNNNNNTAPSIAYTTIMMEGSFAETNINSVALVGNCVAHKQQKKSLHLSKVVAGVSSNAASVAPHSDMLVLQVGIPLSALTAPATFLSTGTHLSVDIVALDLASSNLNNRRHIIVNVHEPTSSAAGASPTAIATTTPRSATISKKKEHPINSTAYNTMIMGVVSVNPQHCRISLPADIQKQSSPFVGCDRPQDVSTTSFKGPPTTRKAATTTTNNKTVEENIQWFSLVIDAKSIIEKLYNTSFKGIESVSITGSNIQLRRVFCCCESREIQEDFTYYHLPRLMSFPVDIDSSIVIDSSNIKVKSENATPSFTSLPRRTAATTSSSPSTNNTKAHPLQQPPPSRITYGISAPRPENVSVLTSPLKSSPSRPTAATVLPSNSNFSVPDTRKAAVVQATTTTSAPPQPPSTTMVVTTSSSSTLHHSIAQVANDDDPTLDIMSSIPTSPHQHIHGRRSSPQSIHKSSSSSSIYKSQQRRRYHDPHQHQDQEEEEEHHIELSAVRRGGVRDESKVEDDDDLTPIRHDMADVASTVDCSFTVEYPSFNHLHHHPSSSQQGKPSLPKSPPPALPMAAMTTTSSSSMENYRKEQQHKTGISPSPLERPSIRPTTITTTTHHHHLQQQVSSPPPSHSNNRECSVDNIPRPSPVFVDTTPQQSPPQPPQNNNNYPPTRHPLVENDRFSQCDGTVSMSSDSASEFEIERNVQAAVSSFPSPQQTTTNSNDQQQQEMSPIKQSTHLMVTTKSSEQNEVEFERYSSDSSKMSDVTVVLMAVGGRGGQPRTSPEATNHATRPSTVRILRPPTKVSKQQQYQTSTSAAPLVSQSLPSRVPKKLLQSAVEEDRTFISEPMSFLLHKEEATPSSTHKTSSYLRQSKDDDVVVARTPTHQHWYDVQDWIAQTGSSSHDFSHPSPASNDLVKDEDEVEFDPVIGCYFNTKSNTYEYPK